MYVEYMIFGDWIPNINVGYILPRVFNQFLPVITGF